MNSKTIGFILLVVGVIALAVSLLADVIGIGGSAGFGRNQIIGATVGLVVALIGGVLAMRK